MIQTSRDRPNRNVPQGNRFREQVQGTREGIENKGYGSPPRSHDRIKAITVVGKHILHACLCLYAFQTWKAYKLRFGPDSLSRKSLKEHIM